ncbi:MAG: hypothetical protein SGPRY_007017 [Prymnesium sp.]
MAAEEFRVALKRNNKGLGIIFDEGDMSVKRVVTGCVAAEDGTIQHGDILLSVKRDDFPEVLAVQASEDLSVLFPPGDYLFEMRFLRTRPLREPSGAPTHALRGRSEWERPKRVGISCQPVSRGKKYFLPFADAPCSLWMMRDNHAVIGLCIGSPNESSSKVCIIAASSITQAFAWLSLLGGRLLMTQYNVPDLELREMIAAFKVFDSTGKQWITLTETQQVAKALGREMSSQKIGKVVTDLGLQLNLQMALNIAQVSSFLCIRGYKLQSAAKFAGLVSCIPPTALDIEEALISAFECLDTEQKGWISHETLKVLDCSLCHLQLDRSALMIASHAFQEVLMHTGLARMSDEEVQDFLDRADGNRDGRIEYHEFVEAQRRLLGLPKKRKHGGAAYQVSSQSLRNLISRPGTLAQGTHVPSPQ